MRLGFAVPQVGSAAGPNAVITVAQGAEALGFDSLWVLDRILYPVNPRAPYPVGDGSLPAKYKNVLDPLETLAFAAAHSRRVALGTSVLNLPWYTPVLLARQLTTLDILSGGRLRIGFGIGWSPDEYEAVSTPWQERGKRADELIQALKTIWTTDPVEFQGEYYRIPRWPNRPDVMERAYHFAAPLPDWRGFVLRFWQSQRLQGCSRSSRRSLQTQSRSNVADILSRLRAVTTVTLQTISRTQERSRRKTG